MADRYPCVDCRKDVAATKNNRYRSHTMGDGEPCGLSSVDIPEHVLENGPVDPKAPRDVPLEGVDYAVCPQCDRKVKLTRLGYFENHDETLRGGDRCPVSGVRAKHARKQEDVPLPGDEKPKQGATIPEVSAQQEITSPALISTSGAEEAEDEVWRTNVKQTPMIPDRAPSVASSASMGCPSLESTTTLTVSPEPPPVTAPGTPSDAPGSPGESASADLDLPPLDPAPFSLGVSVSERFLQPFSPFSQPVAIAEPAPDTEGIPVPQFLQPPEYTGPVKPEPMGELAKELATKIKETFYAYSNRKTTDNRSAQTTLGPSEIGTPCDRRLAMALMGVPPVNPGGDGWAAFVGTCTHVGMAEVYTFADAGTGRYEVELPVFLGVPTVPRGTTDLLDRRDGTVVDWKVMGDYSLKKFKKEGPSSTYRTQAHVYGLGAERGGEKVRNVAIVGLPRAGSSLDQMHVWTEKYDRKFAQAALDRVERIANQIAGTWAGFDTPAGKMRKARSFQTGDDCRYCPFHLKGDSDMQRGCPGE